ncbi:MAG: hypothetical protein ABIR33_12265 [Pyrinomonadaceae bacterium]
MMMMEAEHQRIREALLHGGAGIASVDPEQLLFIESELIEDHLEGSLTPSESELFHENFLVNEERRELLNEVRMLKRFSSDAFEFDASVFDEPSESPVDSQDSSYRVTTVIVILAITAILFVLFTQLMRT